jgi:hypothetical protein
MTRRRQGYGGQALREFDAGGPALRSAARREGGRITWTAERVRALYAMKGEGWGVPAIAAAPGLAPSQVYGRVTTDQQQGRSPAEAVAAVERAEARRAGLATAPAETRKKRRCLKHGGLFWSTHAGNRICERCKHTSARHDSPYLDAYPMASTGGRVIPKGGAR